MYIFGISRGADVVALGREFSEEAAEEAAQLPDYVYIHYHTRSGAFELVDDPESWYIDLDRQLPKDMKRKPSEMAERRPLFEDQGSE